MLCGAVGTGTSCKHTRNCAPAWIRAHSSHCSLTTPWDVNIGPGSRVPLPRGNCVGRQR
ncbi:hypothetical protein T484DRAFT_1932791 [Baffinella frigidus]|nr:hypothetical protein T484DRAFT_1932791 [Cryptophyta sp. CCMP2293]